MGKVFVALVLLFSLTAVSCSGSDESTDKQVSTDQVNTQPNAGDNEGDPESQIKESDQSPEKPATVVSDDGAKPLSELNCLNIFNDQTRGKSVEKMAMGVACGDAYNEEKIDFAVEKVEVISNTGVEAAVRVTGYSTNCARYCPGSVEYSFVLFYNAIGQWWEVKNYSEVFYYRSESEIQ